MLGDIIHESQEFLDPREVAVAVKKVDVGLAHVPTAVKRVPRLAVIVVKPEYVNRDVELLLDHREVDQTYGLFDRIQSVLLEFSIRVSSWSICLSVRIVRKKSRQDRLAETAFVVVSDIDDSLLIREELGKL